MRTLVVLNESPFETGILESIFQTTMAEVRCICGPSAEWETLEVRIRPAARVTARYLTEGHSADFGLPPSNVTKAALALKFAAVLQDFSAPPAHVRRQWDDRVKRAIETCFHIAKLEPVSLDALAAAELQVLRAKRYRKQLQLKRLSKSLAAIDNSIAAIEDRLTSGRGMAA